MGQYDSLRLGRREKSFVNRHNLDHFFFKKGIHDEATAWVFGVLLTDGSVGRRAQGGWATRLEMTDHDIVEKAAMALQFQGRLSESKTRNTKRLVMTSAYLAHDLTALGCGERKTESANYPVLEDDLDRHFIRGVIDGDGSWVHLASGLVLLMVCGHDELIYGLFKTIEQHLGIRPQSLQYPGEWDDRIKMTSFCAVRYGQTDSIRIRDWLYADATIYGNRKYAKAHGKSTTYHDSLNTPALALHLGVSETFVKKNIRKHELPHKQIGPYYVFDDDMVPAWEEFLRARLRDPRCKLPNRDQLRSRWLGD